MRLAVAMIATSYAMPRFARSMAKREAAERAELSIEPYLTDESLAERHFVLGALAFGARLSKLGCDTSNWVLCTIRGATHQLALTDRDVVAMLNAGEIKPLDHQTARSARRACYVAAYRVNPECGGPIPSRYLANLPA